MPKSPTRQPIADWVKGIAITLMVYGHITQIGTLATLQHNVVELIYTFHMPLFLIVSGFFLSTEINFSDAARRLGRRIAAPYLIFISLYLFGLLVVQHAGISTNNAPPRSAADFFHIVLLEPRGGYWFLHSIIVLQLCYFVPTIYRSSATANAAIRMIATVALLLIVTRLGLITIRTAVYFTVGVVARRYSEVIPTQIILGLCLGGLCIGVGFDEIYGFSLMQIAWCLAILLFIGGIGEICSHTKVFDLFVWLGRNSLVVLVLHAIFIVAMKSFANLILRAESSGIAYSLISTSAVLVGSIAAARACDRLGFSVYLFGTRSVYVPLEGYKAKRSSIAVS